MRRREFIRLLGGADEVIESEAGRCRLLARMRRAATSALVPLLGG
jgi:hypothetical protein